MQQLRLWDFLLLCFALLTKNTALSFAVGLSILWELVLIRAFRYTNTLRNNEFHAYSTFLTTKLQDTLTALGLFLHLLKQMVFCFDSSGSRAGYVHIFLFKGCTDSSKKILKSNFKHGMLKILNVKETWKHTRLLGVHALCTTANSLFRTYSSK